MNHIHPTARVASILAALAAGLIALAAAPPAAFARPGPQSIGPTAPATPRPPSAPAVSGIEHFQSISTSATAATQGVIAFGVFTAPGADHITDTFVFPAGTFKLTHSKGTGTPQLNPKTCLFTLSVHGTYKIFGGTGTYAGISGSGTYQLRVLAITARSGGNCTMTKPPVAFQRTLKAAGPVTL